MERTKVIAGAVEEPQPRPAGETEGRRSLARLLLSFGARLRKAAHGPRPEDALVALTAETLRAALGGDPDLVWHLPDPLTGALEPRQHFGPHPALRPAPLPAGGNGAPPVAPTQALLAQEAPVEIAGEDTAVQVVPCSRFMLPLLGPDGLIGLFDLYRPATRPFGPREVEAGRLIADRAAIAIENARLALCQWRPDDTGAELIHAPDGRIVAASEEAGALFGRKPETMAGALLTDYLPPEEHRAARTWLTQIATVGVPPVTARLRYYRANGQVGILLLAARGVDRPEPGGKLAVRSVLRDVTAEQQQRAALEMKVRELDALIAVSESLNSSLNLDEVLRETLRALTAVVACPTATLRLYDERRRALVPVAVQGWPADERPIRTLDINAGAIGATVRAGRIAYFPDFHQAPGLQPFTREDSPRAMLVVPLMRGRQPLGCFTLLRPLGRGFSDEERRLAAAVARQTAIALENARLFGRVQRQLQQINELQGLAADLVSDLDIDSALERICRTLANLLGAEKTGVRFLSDSGAKLLLAAGHGLSPALTGRLGQTVAADGPDAKRALETRACVVTPDLREVSDWPQRDLLLEEGVIAICTVPILGKGQQPLGVLFATWPTPHQLAHEEIETVGAYANYAAAAIENARLFSRTRELYLAGIHSLAATVDARDAYTHRHSRNVAFYAREMARELGLPQDEVENIELAALLHDIGKIGISDAILSKPGKLSTDEMSIMVTHAAQGAAILSVNAALAPLVPLVKHHHEWYNGSGYPDGLARDDIPLGAAIIGVADAFDTMTTDRSYRRARSLETALQELRRHAGRQFNPRVVDAFTRVLERDEAARVPYVARLQELHTTELGSMLHTLVEANPEDDESLGQIRPRQLKELTVLHHLARTVGTITDLDRFLAGALEVIKREFGHHDCALLLIDEQTGELVVHAVSGFAPSLIGRRRALGQDLSSWAIAHRQSRNVRDIAQEPRYVVWREESRSALVVPLISAGQAVGAIAIESPREAAFSADDELTLETIANQLANAVAVARLHDREKRAAVTDGLTGVYNHRHFYQRLEEELARLERGGGRLAVLIMDLNGLKALNDTRGHLAGDAALRMVADLLRDCTRRIDIVARYGGDEFAVILPEAGPEDAARLLERLKVRLLAARATVNGITIGPLTVSVGIATAPADGTRAAALVAAADQRMYEQKKRGASPTRERTAKLDHRRQALSRLKYQ